MDTQKIIQDPHFKEFINSRSIRESTKSQYLIRLTNYCNFLNKTPTELIEEAENEEDERLRMKKRKIKKYLNDYHIKLIEDNKSPHFIKSSITTIRSFYTEFEIELPRTRIKQEITKKIVTTDDIVGKEHILKVLEYCNIRYKTIILLMSSSGMGRAEIRHLTYNDFLNAISEYYKPLESEQFDIYSIAENLQDNLIDIIPTWQIRRHKTNMPFVTFSSPESTQSLIYYLIDRVKQNKPIKSLDDWLFESVGHQISNDTFIDYFAKLNDKCDYGFVGSHRFFTSHKLRKYFASTLNKNNVPKLTVDWFLGHSIESVTDAYFKLDMDSLKEQYKRVVEELSIEKVITREITTKEYEIIIQELEKEREARALADEDHKKSMIAFEEKMEDKMSKLIKRHISGKTEINDRKTIYDE